MKQPLKKVYNVAVGERFTVNDLYKNLPNTIRQ